MTKNMSNNFDNNFVFDTQRNSVWKFKNTIFGQNWRLATHWEMSYSSEKEVSSTFLFNFKLDA